MKQQGETTQERNTGLVRTYKEPGHIVKDKRTKKTYNYDTIVNGKGLDKIIKSLYTEGSDSENAVLAINAGNGGEDAALFVGNLFSMYTRYIESKGWKVNNVSSSPSSMGGYKEVIIEVIGKDAFKCLKNETGIHKIQRVPITETRGRVHTSTASVNVLPKGKEVEAKIDIRDLKIELVIKQ